MCFCIYIHLPPRPRPGGAFPICHPCHSATSAQSRIMCIMLSDFFANSHINKGFRKTGPINARELADLRRCSRRCAVALRLDFGQHLLHARTRIRGAVRVALYLFCTLCILCVDLMD